LSLTLFVFGYYSYGRSTNGVVICTVAAIDSLAASRIGKIKMVLVSSPTTAVVYVDSSK